MKYCFLLMIIALVSCNDGAKKNEEKEKAAETKTSKRSDAFNKATAAALQSYYDLTEAYVQWDSAAIPAKTQDLATKIQGLPLSELGADSTAAIASRDSLKLGVAAIAKAGNITESRHALYTVTDEFYRFLNTVQYDKEKIYLQECPMAFNDEEPGIWLSAKDEIRNPYLGLHHPRYGKGMLACGENKAVINYTGSK